MIEYPAISPVIVEIGPLAIRWYGMMYLGGFVAAYLLGRKRARLAWTPLKPESVEDLVFYCAIGVVLGGRFGYVLFYGFESFLADPLWLFRIWEGGMSFHGGLLGVFLAIVLFARKIERPLGDVADFVAPMAPIGLGLGRLANFINGELWGRASDVPWAMVFPTDPHGLARHPSQLYQAVLEGVVLLAIVLLFARKPRPGWSVTAVFLMVYGVARFLVEFFREPDAGLAFDWMTRGQLLSTPMIVGGIILFLWASRSTTAPDKNLHPDSQLTQTRLASQGELSRGGKAKRRQNSKKRKKKR